jgi:S1-C subfamily serine protease
VAYAFVGVRTMDVTPTLASNLGLAVTRGALVVKVESGTGAADAGLRAGTTMTVVNGVSVPRGSDVIVAIAGRKVQTGEDVARIVAEELKPGQTVPFTVLRGGRRLVVPVHLGSRQA